MTTEAKPAEAKPAVTAFLDSIGHRARGAAAEACHIPRRHIVL
jgi:hypothetical protein